MDEINNMTSEQLQEKFGNVDGIKIIGNVTNLNELVEKISRVVKTLYVSGTKLAVLNANNCAGLTAGTTSCINWTRISWRRL